MTVEIEREIQYMIKRLEENNIKVLQNPLLPELPRACQNRQERCRRQNHGSGIPISEGVLNPVLQRNDQIGMELSRWRTRWPTRSA